MEQQTSLPFPEFWNWIVTHPNCILRAGTPEAVLYDDEDLHWHFASEGPELLVVQLMRGKRMLGELLLAPNQISYVRGVEGDQDGEVIFELVQESEKESLVAYFFVLAHGFDEETSATPIRVH